MSVHADYLPTQNATFLYRNSWNQRNAIDVATAAILKVVGGGNKPEAGSEVSNSSYSGTGT